MSKFKIIGLFCLAASMFFIPAQNAFASDIIVNQQSAIIENNSECLEDVEAEYIVNYVQSMLEKKYKNFFSLDNFNATFIDAKNDTDSIDFDISVDMTYIKNPEETDYVKGMYEAITEIQNNVEKEIAQQTLNEYLEEQNSYYMVPERTAFCYRIKMPKTKNYKSNISDCILYNRTDITDEKVLLTPIVNAKSVEDINVLTKEEGKERIFRDIEKQKKNSTTYAAKAVSYNKSKAVEYAKNHVADTPEFSKANNLGSDCANFLSYCIHAGGIPIDENGLWRPSHYGKNKDDTYAGDNWMKTGFYKDQNGKKTGVKTYMVQHKYFEKKPKTDAVKGGFMFWTQESHVALIMSNANGVIKYYQHSNVKQKNEARTYDSQIPVSFFNPII